MEEGEIICLEGDGTPSKLMILGEAPGYQEARAGKPFVGAAGELLDKILTKSGLERERLFVTNVIKCRPPGNRNPTEGEETACSVFLERELVAVKPAAIMTLGNYALRAITGEWGVTKNAGKWRIKEDFIAAGKLLPPFGVLPNFHPAYILRQRNLTESFQSIVDEFANFYFTELL